MEKMKEEKRREGKRTKPDLAKQKKGGAETCRVVSTKSSKKPLESSRHLAVTSARSARSDDEKEKERRKKLKRRTAGVEKEKKEEQKEVSSEERSPRRKIGSKSKRDEKNALTSKQLSTTDDEPGLAPPPPAAVDNVTPSRARRPLRGRLRDSCPVTSADDENLPAQNAVEPKSPLCAPQPSRIRSKSVASSAVET